MARWNLVIPDETDWAVRSYLARTGSSNGDLADFVDRAVRQTVFSETLELIWERNKELSPGQAQKLADDAVNETRMSRS